MMPIQGQMSGAVMLNGEKIADELFLQATGRMLETPRSHLAKHPRRWNGIGVWRQSVAMGGLTPKSPPHCNICPHSMRVWSRTRMPSGNVLKRLRCSAALKRHTRVNSRTQ